MDNAAVVINIATSFMMAGGIATYHGPSEIDEGTARLLLARFDREHGTKATHLLVKMFLLIALPLH